MAIKIPSKHIYDISFNPVIDNNIDYIEVSANNPQTINDTENVYNEKVNNEFIADIMQKDQQNGATYSVSSVGTYAAIAYVELTPTYITKSFTIPKNIKNSRILRILTGKDDNEQSNIKYSLRGNTKIGEAIGEGAVIRNRDSSFTYANSVINIQPNNIVETDNISYTLPDITDAVQETYSVPEINASTHQPMSTATASVKLNNKSNILSVTAVDNGDSFSIISLKVLAGIKIIKLGGKVNAKLGSITNPDFSGLYTPISGTYEEYIPSQIEISFYGDTISLELQEESVSFGDGNNPFALQGNELIQITGSEMPEYSEITSKLNIKANKLLYSESMNLDIADDEHITSVEVVEYNTAIIDSVNISNISANKFTYSALLKNMPTADTTTSIIFAVRIGYAESSLKARIKNLMDKWQNGKQTAVISCPITDYYDTNGNKVIDINTGEKMVFDIGDIVEPYIYTNNGDKPLSYNKDFTPKQFEVVGTDIYTEQGITQELTLLEI